MSLTNPKNVVTEERLSEFYGEILPYLGGMPEALANKFSKSDLYSTDEKIIGCWTDGKPVYQKTIATTIGTSLSTAKTVSLGISIDSFVDISGYLISNDTYNPINCPTNAVDHIIKVYARTNSYSTASERNTLQIFNTVEAFVSKPIYITIQYTKTTDAANSFKYGNETDYSTDEKIIGTWIDGKPIYQKVIVDTFPTSGNTKYVSIGASVDWADGDVLVKNADGVMQKLTSAKFVNGEVPEWSLRFAFLLNNYASNPNKVQLNNIGGTGYNNQPVYIIIRYTKTTD